jgi:hypothetical protein
VDADPHRNPYPDRARDHLGSRFLSSFKAGTAGSVLVWDRTRIPTPIEWFNLATGQRTPFAVFDPRDRTWVLAVSNVEVSEDERSYVVGVFKWRDLLYTADPVR